MGCDQDGLKVWVEVLDGVLPLPLVWILHAC